MNQLLRRRQTPVVPETPNLPPYVHSAESHQTPEAISIPVTVKTVLPKRTLEQSNTLGIKEVIGTGTSLYQHSIPGRAYNIAHATEKFYGVLVKPEEVFSFVKTL